MFLFLAVCVLQGVDAGPEGLKLISEVIRGKLGITMTVLMGANIANEVADEKFCETTIGMEDRQQVDFLLFITRKQPVHKLTQQAYFCLSFSIGGHSGYLTEHPVIIYFERFFIEPCSFNSPVQLENADILLIFGYRVQRQSLRPHPEGADADQELPCNCGGGI